MKYIYIILFLMILVTLMPKSYSYEGTISPCTLKSSFIYYNNTSNKIYIPCCGSADTLDLIVIDPAYPNIIEKQFHLNGKIKQVYPIDNGAKLLILLSVIVGDPSDENGQLIKIDYNSGDRIGNSYNFINYCPLDMVIDCNEEYVFVSGGLGNPGMPEPKVTKISINNFQFINEVELWGDTPDDIEITNGSSKIYVKEGSYERRGNYPNYTYYGTISVFDAYDLERLPEVETPFCVTSIEMGYDNRLFACQASPWMDRFALAIIDTTLDQVIKTINLGDDGINFMEHETTSGKLFGTLWPKTFWSEVEEEYINGPSNQVIVFDLTDPDYPYEIITMGNNPLWAIAVAPSNNPNYSCRVFVTEEDTNVVHYKDY